MSGWRRWRVPALFCCGDPAACGAGGSDSSPGWYEPGTRSRGTGCTRIFTCCNRFPCPSAPMATGFIWWPSLRGQCRLGPCADGAHPGGTWPQPGFKLELVQLTRHLRGKQ